jgi:hypothetical protein
MAIPAAVGLRQPGQCSLLVRGDLTAVFMLSTVPSQAIADNRLTTQFPRLST